MASSPRAVEPVAQPLGSSRTFALLLAGLWVLLLVLAAIRPLALPDEGRYAELGRWMLVSGDWLVPRLDGVPYFRKPPLAYWLEAASMALFGVNAFALRLPAALHAALLVGATHWALRRLAGPALAQQATLMLAASVAVLLGGQFANHDMLVAAWVALAIWCFVLALEAGDRPHAGLARAGFAAAAMGMLSKGLLGVALPGLVLLGWVVWTRRWKALLQLPWASGLLIFGLIAAPWFVLAEGRHPGMLHYMFGVGHFQRYTSQSMNNAQPWWFHLGVVALTMLPWTLVIAAGWLWPRARRAERAPAWRAARMLGVIWVVAIVGFFSVPRSKLPGYTLPAMPAVALLAALAWSALLAGRRHAGRWLIGLAAVPVLAITATSIGYESTARGKLARETAQALACQARPSDDVYVVGGYPYDLAFTAQITKPLQVIDDWPNVAQTAGDSWRRQRVEGARFDPAAGTVALKTPDVLPAALQRSGQWLVLHTNHPSGAAPVGYNGWQLVKPGRVWSLYRSPSTVAAAPGEGLPGCARR